MSEETEKKAIEFEKQHGALNLMKVCLSALNNILIKKGLVEKEELEQEFLKIIDERERELK